MEKFVVEELQNVFTLDALVSSHPISVEVSDPNEINEIFDGISYSKGNEIKKEKKRELTFYTLQVARKTTC